MTGRTTTILASGFVRDRVHSIRLTPTEVRTLVANFTNVLPAGQTIASVRWQLDAPGVASLASPAIEGKLATVSLTAYQPGEVGGRCTMVTSAGQTFPQPFVVQVRGYAFNDPSTGGSIDVSAVA